MLDCGEPERMGFVQYRCCNRGEIRRFAFTRNSCFCLSCGKVYTIRWADFIARRLLPGVTYRHVVLTMPGFFRIWFFRNPTLLSPFMRAGRACLKGILHTWAGVKLAWPVERDFNLWFPIFTRQFTITEQRLFGLD